MQVPKERAEDTTPISYTRALKIPAPVGEESTDHHRGLRTQILEPNLSQIHVELSKVVAIVGDRFVAKPTLIAQVREEARHAVGERLAWYAVARVANKSRYD
jgi:hypothetical protein